MKISLTIFFFIMFGICFAQQRDSFITKEKAIDIANNDLGFGNTWIEVRLKKSQWQLYSPATNDNPPIYMVLDAVNGNILLRVYNTNDSVQDKKHKKFLKRINKEDYVEPEWVRGVSKVLHGITSVFINLRF